MATTHFCPYCRSTQPAFEYWEGTYPIVRCETCGYPVERAVAKEEGACHRRPLLLIDDDPLLLGFFTQLAAGHAFEPLTARDGATGVRLAQQQHPALILVDVLMPGLNGFDVCWQLRADPGLKDTPIIILTARKDPALRLKGFKVGATLALEKPFEPEQLLRIIRAALALHPKPPPPTSASPPRRDPAAGAGEEDCTCQRGSG